MHLFFLLPALLLLLAAFLWYTQAHTPASVPPPDGPAKIEPDAHIVDSLAGAVAALQELMEHPALGGPGFLTVRVCDGRAAVTGQYPNIRETLYQHVIRKKVSPADLLPEGFPETLLGLSPEFEAESGGMVLVTVTVPGLTQDVSSCRSRQLLLNALVAELRPRFPGLSIRILGGELILAPVRQAADV